MEHLTTQELSRLVDETPTEAEVRHLEACEACATSLRALRQQTEALGELPDMRPPSGDWEVLQARLVSEGLVRSGSRLGMHLARTPAWMKAAAAVVLFLSGAFMGGVAVRGPASVVPGIGGATSFAGGPLPSVQAEVSSLEDAARLVRMTERQYMDALVQYQQMVAAEGDPSAVPDPEQRFAALDYIMRAGQAALREAPTDPFLNGLVASAVAEREAALRRISAPGDENWF